MSGIRQKLIAFIGRLARSAPGGRLLTWGITHMSFALPVKRLRETDLVLAFHHPQPNYPFHVLIVPKKPIADLLAITPQDGETMQACLTVAQELVQEFNLTPGGYRLIVNGGAYQDIPQIHFHLVADRINSTSQEGKA